LCNTTLRLFTNSTSTGSLNITLSKKNMTSNELVNDPGIYVDIVTSDDSIRKNLSYAVLIVNYTDSEVSSLVESSLRLHRWNTTSQSWDKLSGAGSPRYVNDAGVDTANKSVWANLTNLSEFGVSGEQQSVQPVQQFTASSGGGGGGGGAGPSGENFTNIELRESYDLHIFKDIVTSYRFRDVRNPIASINITGNVNAGEINVAVEVLRNTSSLVNSPAPGTVQKNVNVWVGTRGFAQPGNIKTALIRFRVPGTWLESNGIEDSEIKMVRWDGSGWVTLETAVKEKDTADTYFEAATDTFSPLAITGMKAPQAVPQAAAVTSPEPTPEIMPPVKQQMNWALIIGVLAVIFIAAAIYLRMSRK
ncbi:MAG: PGF-pre-PGF domain-containing protein, partial [Candidatus Methanoperedens sp.]|nr:PGF-pre-PGF domain-containing protein [Candidatus Methanoperedens sp.]